MSVVQLAVFLENKAGRLAEVTRVLGEAGVNIRGFSVADTMEYGILRLIVDKPTAARDALKQREFTVHSSRVLCVQVSDRPGGLARILDALGQQGINIEYMYPIGIPLIVFGVEDPDRAVEVIRRMDAQILDEAEIERL